MTINRLFAATAVAAAAALTLSACFPGGSSDSTSGAPASAGGEVSGTLTGVFSSQFKDTYEKIAKGFTEKNPNVKVDFSYQGGDIGQVVLTQLQAGTAPDILTSFPGGDVKDNSDNVVPLAAHGRIAPLNVTWADKIPPAWASNFSYEGKLFAYPGAFQPLSALYNQTKLDEVGLKIPTTLDEVYKLCADAKAKGVYAYAQGLGEAAAGPQMLSFAQNATLIDGPNPDFAKQLATGQTTYPDSAWVTQFEIYDKMFKDGCFGEGSLGRSREQGATAAASGQALGIVDVGAVLAGMQKSAPNASFVVAPLPATNDGATFITALPGFVTTINAKAKNPAAAQAFLEFMGTPEASATYAEGFASVPVLPNDQYKPPADLKVFSEMITAGKYAPLQGLQAEVQSTLNQQLQAMFLGKKTPRDVAQSMQNAYKK
jgi:raffinose/stachyose/melibiose transport system substrate-binding protein